MRTLCRVGGTGRRLSRIDWYSQTNLIVSSLVSTPPTASDDPASPAAASKLDNFGSEECNELLVYYLGGVTFMEIAALRHLSRQPDCPYDIIVATTKIIIGDTLLKPCFDKEVLRFLKL